MSTITPDGPTREELLDALRAVREAIGIPHAATVGDQEVRDQILVAGAGGHAVAMLDSILSGKDWLDVPWDVEYLRARLAEHPAAGYKTWGPRGFPFRCAGAVFVRAGGPGQGPGGVRPRQRRRRRP